MPWLYSASHGLFIDEPSDRRIWHRAWLLSGSTALAALASLSLVAELSGQSLIILISYTLLPIVLLMLGVAFVVMATGHARLWLLYSAHHR